MTDKKKQEMDLIIIGAGLSGLAAACFAVRHGLRTAVVAWSRGELPFASGALDILGVYPLEEKRELKDPWAGIARLIQDHPEHPYARIGVEGIREALEEFLSLLSDAGLSYCGHRRHNSALLTACGTKKITYRVPGPMWPGVKAFYEKRPTLLVDFDGMKDYSALQIAEAARSQWPGIEALRVEFPYLFLGKDRHNILMAEALESPEVRKSLADIVRLKVKGFDFIGFPAILGTRRHQTVASDLEEMIGVPVFEIPTLPPSVPGHRLMTALDQKLTENGVNIMVGRRAMRVLSNGSRCTGIVIGDEKDEEILMARGIILAGGRFIGGGLIAGMDGIREALLGLSVYQPKSREGWHRKDFLDSRGHPINRAGIRVDAHCRPMDEKGCCLFENLFAVGSVLAHHDWAREKCGAGLAIASAHRAVKAFLECSFVRDSFETATRDQ